MMPAALTTRSTTKCRSVALNQISMGCCATSIQKLSAWLGTLSAAGAGAAACAAAVCAACVADGAAVGGAGAAALLMLVLLP